MAEASTAVPSGKDPLFPVKVYRLIIEPISNQPVVILSDLTEELGMPIWIDRFEANAIHSEINGIDHRRPLTHDLLERIMEKAKLKIHRVVVTHLDEGVYYATILMDKGGAMAEIDARPSDSIVMALKFNAPIFVSESLFKEVAVALREQKEEQKGIVERYGLTFQDLTPPLARSFSYESTEGILVSNVREGSRAEKDGIKRGDILVEVGGRAVDDASSMRDALERIKSAVHARIFRKGSFLSITIHPH